MTPEDEIFRLAAIDFGPKFNRGRVKSFADSMYMNGYQDAVRKSFKFDKEIREILKRSAVPLCHSCDGTGIFYGNVSVCPCTFDSRNNTQLADRMAKNAQINALFKTVEHAHVNLIESTRLALELFRSYLVVKDVRYWYHAESDSLFTTCGEDEARLMCERAHEDLLELDRDDFRERLRVDLEKRVTANSENEAENSEIDQNL